MPNIVLTRPLGQSLRLGELLHRKFPMLEQIQLPLLSIVPNENPADAIMDAIAAHGDEYVVTWESFGLQWMHTKAPENRLETANYKRCSFKFSCMGKRRNY